MLFCTYFRLTPAPAELDTICLYVQFLSRTLSPPTIRNYLSGVKLFHLFSGLDFPYTKDFLLSLTLRGIARNALHTPRRAPPVTPYILYQMSRVLDFKHDPMSCALFCAFLFTFFLMARLANIVPSSRNSFDPRRNLTRSDVVANEHGIIVTFRSTKTIQFGERQLHIPLLRLPGSPLCPVSAYHRMVRLISASPRSPCFFCLAHEAALLSQSTDLSPNFVACCLLRALLIPLPLEAILFVEALPHGLSITGFRANLFSYTETGPVTLIRSI